MDKIIWKLSPLKCVGCITFGENAEKIINHLGLIKLPPDCENATWDTYELSIDGTRFTVENGTFISVVCIKNLIYHRVNLIGLCIDKVREMLGREDSFEDNIGEESALYYPKLGLTLWLKEGEVVGATCNGR